MEGQEKYFIELSAKLIEDEFGSVLKSVTSLGKKAAASINLATGQAFKNYFATCLNKYVSTKTILYRDRPVYLYDFYVHLDLMDDKKDRFNTENVSDLSKISNYLLITGTAGCGKSTLIKHLFLNTIERRCRIPLYIELRNINDTSDDLLAFIQKHLASFNLKIDSETFLKLVEAGRFLMILDGFDEINQEKADSVATQLIALRDKYHNNTFVVTSRPDDRFVSWSSFRELSVAPLTKEQGLALIAKLDYDPDIKTLFYSRVEKELYKKHESFLSNPLLLTIMLMTFSAHADIPEKTHIFYSQAFETLFSRHDATKAGYKRKHFTKLPADDFRTVLSAFCVQTYLENEIIFSKDKAIHYLKQAQKITGFEFSPEDVLKDLLLSLCLLVQDGYRYTFAHRTFQEYFSALFIISAKPSIRPQLIKRLESKLGIDLTGKMIFEIARNAIEDDYLIARMEEIRAGTKYGEVANEVSFIEFCKMAFSSINLLGEPGEVYPIRRRRSPVDRVIRFVTDCYQGFYPFKRRWKVEKAKEAALASRIEQLADKDTHPRRATLQTILDDPEALALIPDGLWWVNNYFQFAMSIQDDIKTDKLKREQSIETILLS